jgi:hypothetical protein
LPAGAPVDYDVWSCVHPDDLARVEAAVQRCADPQGDGLYDIEYRVIGKADGLERWIATRGQTNFENRMPASFHGYGSLLTSPIANVSRKGSSVALKLERANWRKPTGSCALRSSNARSLKPRSGNCNGSTQSGKSHRV